MRRKSILASLLTSSMLVISGCNIATKTAAATLSIPKSALSTNSLGAILPHGTKIGRYQLIENGSSVEVVIVTNPGEFSPIRGWVAVGSWDNGTKQWNLVWLNRAYGDNTPSIIVGPTHGNNHAIGLLYYEGATGYLETIDVLNVTPTSVGVMRSVTEVEDGNIRGQNGSFLISWTNTAELDGWSTDGHWTHHSLSPKQILDQANIHVLYAQKTDPNYGNPVISEVVIGNTTIHAKENQTVSFIPANSAAWTSLKQVQIYSNNGNGPVQFSMANLMRENVVSFWAPGVYRFAIVPPNEVPSTVNDTMAEIEVIVTK